MLGAAREGAREAELNIKFVSDDAEAPPFETASFDVVSSRHVLFNLHHPGVAVCEWLRLLHPGGRLILIGDNMDHARAPTLAEKLKRPFGWLMLRLTRDVWSGPEWRPSANYLNIVSSMPLFRHHSGVLQAVMEAAGAINIQYIDTKTLRLTRERRFLLARRWYFPPSQPFILVGTKPD
ncbi:MAG: class I SAM-dependent methyltransferase [Planctomycetes bacterium]|nr:class I SAM-dependent methyltransferase [Planctomycetota bacterium]